MAVSMSVDVIRLHWFGVAAGLIGVLLITSFFVGIFGPGTHTSYSVSAYNCSDGSHTWSPLCNGVQLGHANTSFSYQLKPLTKMNGFWSMIVYPYVENNDEFLIEVEVSVSGSKDGETWKQLVSGATRQEVVVCNARNPTPPIECWGFVVLYEDSISYPYYSVQFSFPDNDNNQKELIGDVTFEFVSYSEDYSVEQLVVRSIYACSSLLLLAVFAARLWMFPLRDSTLEQRGLLAVIVATVVLNNVLFGLQFAVAGWFFPLLDELCHLVHSAVVLLFWLFVFDYYRKGELEFKLHKWDIAKPLVVGIWVAFTAVFFTWFRIARDLNPVLGNGDHVNGDVIFFFLCALLFGGILVWVLVLMMLAMPVIWNKRHFAARYIFTGSIAAFVLVSILAALFFGSYGPMRITSLPFIYFFTLFNAVPWLLAFGYWPLRSSFSEKISNPSEDTPIFGAAGSSISTDNL